MPLFYTDSVTLAYSNVEGAKRWWIDAFDCKVARVPPDWDCPLPSDVALQLPGHSAPTILLSAKAEVEQAISLTIWVLSANACLRQLH